ncbi:DNA-3-methyladenine glycosylase I [Occultella glacieicola]|uniref:DNA-3-methyladenine glycosylase I n=1 Tax=Occultella glacieicola TaxID=2518684 RepID=A0ABY2E6J7_9MICO|nr:DNA-3-methyladenine glycosylase I [Occultella glacieicola]TDE95817.1 DNA-3-methyladenine glycosylase I [Occultella glacieicola]
METFRCFGTGDALYEAYHDNEWGVPPSNSPDEHELFERVSLEAFQSGLAWITILRKREGFRAAFAGFDPAAVAAFDEGDVARLMADVGIVRNRAKIASTIANARALLDLHERGHTLADVFEAHRPPTRARRVSRFDQVPASTPESTALAKDLKKRGFRFVGPTTAYAAMQALGYVDDHLEGCLSAA